MLAQFRRRQPQMSAPDSRGIPETSRDISTTRTPSSGHAASGVKDFSGTLIGETKAVNRHDTSAAPKPHHYDDEPTVGRLIRAVAD